MMFINVYLFRDNWVFFWMGSQSYPKIIVESPFQTRNDEYYGSVFTSGGLRAIQWNTLAFFFNNTPIQWKVLNTLRHLLF